MKQYCFDLLLGLLQNCNSFIEIFIVKVCEMWYDSQLCIGRSFRARKTRYLNFGEKSAAKAYPWSAFVLELLPVKFLFSVTILVYFTIVKVRC